MEGVGLAAPRLQSCDENERLSSEKVKEDRDIIFTCNVWQKINNCTHVTGPPNVTTRELSMN